MAGYEKVVPTTFDSAADRIRDSIDHLHEIGEPLDAWQSDTLARALAYLQTGNYALAIDAAFRACRPQLYRTKAAEIAFSGSPTVTIAEVRASFEEAENRPLR
ncbi:MAG: hypothetical protein EPO10_27460 [Reyranella sp.]|uniref:hypothetical protein n=1 Tax=Reyranella sp. TaxID=1929291 RepID=UPI0011FFFA2A|nr:hypothetical protein [Reyranella sp.]TAJ96858.1 MAG: hypothetical protein EPO41_04845 [Reyranella sp.]TBR23067.1 MAG: hypothetical protein EPO10_27460 [Reyranella sp.]